jgi:hypothetical protein
LIVEHLNWHWLFWIPLGPVVLAAVLTWRLVPESPIRVASRVNWLAAVLMTAGLSLVLVAISETSTWGWGSPKTLGVLAAGLALCVAWVRTEQGSQHPLVDMTMMRLRGVWTANVAAFLFGGGLYGAFSLFPQFAQLPKGAGFGASVVQAGLYMVPATIGLMLFGWLAGPATARLGSKHVLVVGNLLAAFAFGLLAVAHTHPFEMLISAALLGGGIGFAYAALGNLIVRAVPPHQTGVATGMNTVLRLLGGAIIAQIAASLVAAHTAGGVVRATGYVESFVMGAGLLVVALLAGLLVPDRRAPVSAGDPVGHPPPGTAPEPAVD